ncbi:hypothetical protein QA596_01105 [Balneolales bacterium ANBcel1]|nr:hypothetical protein [Balneolales bacterium ANBcel1]
MNINPFTYFDHIDRTVTRWMAQNGIFLLRISIGFIFIWFGALKLFPGMSPAEEMAGTTIEILTFGLIGAGTGLPILAVWECLIGVGMFVRRYMRFTILMLYLQMIGTFSPIVLLPGIVFESAPFALALEGQYIFKNVVVIAAALVIGATVRGGRLKAEP